MAYCGSCGAQVSSRFCPNCGSATATATEMTSEHVRTLVDEMDTTPFLTGALEEEEGSHAPSVQNGLPAQRKLVPIVATSSVVVAVLLGAGGVVTALDANARAKDLQQQVVSLKTQVADNRSASAAQSEKIKDLAAQMTAIPGQAAITSINKKLAQFTNCIPQLQSQINGLSVNWGIYPDGSRDYFNIANNNIVSNDCSDTLYGTYATD